MFRKAEVPRPRPAPLEATVTSKGQITLPKALRARLGLKRGSRIRFLLDARGRLRGEPVLWEGGRGGFADHLIAQVGFANSCRKAVSFDALFGKGEKVRRRP